MKRDSYLVGKAFRSYLTASVLTVAAAQVAGIVDASIVGNIIGEEGLAAVNVCKPVLQAVFALSVLLVGGGTMMVGMAIGKGDRKRADSVFTLSIGLVVLTAIVLMVTGLFLLDPLLKMLCKSVAVYPLAKDFLRVMLLSAAPMMLMTALDSYVTVDGSPVLASRAVIVSNVVNLCLDVILMKFLGLGITGAAWATCVMYIVCILMVLPHFKKKPSLRLTVDFDLQSIRPLLSYGLPLFLSTILLSVQFAFSNTIAGTCFGDGGLVAYAVCMQLLVFSTIFLNGTFRTVQPVGSILKGMGDSRGVILLMWRAYRFIFCCLAVFGVLAVLFLRQIAHFLGVSDGANMEVVMYAVPVFVAEIILQSLTGNLTPVYQIYGHRRLALLISVLQALLPLAGFWILTRLGMTYEWLNPWSGFALGQFAVLIILLIAAAVIRQSDKSLSHLLLVPLSPENEVLDVSMSANTGELGAVRNLMSDFLKCRNLRSKTVNDVVLCSEELIKNIIDHGSANRIDVKVVSNSNAVVLSLHDDGNAFNPVCHSSPNGIGLTIISEICAPGNGNTLNYNYIFNQNIVTLEITDN